MRHTGAMGRLLYQVSYRSIF